MVIQPFAEPQPGHGTDLNDPLARAPEKIANLRGIVLASDGDWNEGPPPVAGRRAPADAGRAGLRRAGRQPHAPARRRALEPRRAHLRRRRQGGAHPVYDRQLAARETIITTVTLRSSDGDEVTKEVRIAAMSRTSDCVALEAEGDRRLHADARRFPSTATRRWPTTTS